MKTLILLALFLSSLAQASPYIESPPLDRPLLAQTPTIKIITLPEAQLAHLNIPECHDGSMTSTVYACAVNRGYETDIYMPPYPSSHGGAWYSDLFQHELEGHALRGLSHYGNGRGWKKL